MKRIIFLLFLILFLIVAVPVFAADSDFDSGDITDAYKYTQGFENAFIGQKKITDEDFQKALKEVKAKQSKGKKKPKTFKGKNFNDETSGGYIKDAADNVILLSLPVELTNDDGAQIPIGLYKIVGKRTDDDIYLNFYQSSTLVAKVPAVETNSDFNQPEINFVKLIPYDDKRVKIIYGSMDFNAYTFIRIKN